MGTLKGGIGRDYLSGDVVGQFSIEGTEGGTGITSGADILAGGTGDDVIFGDAGGRIIADGYAKIESGRQ